MGEGQRRIVTQSPLGITVQRDSTMITLSSSISTNRRGMTLIEMLVSLSLLAVLVTVAVSWMTSTLSRQGKDLEQSRWDRAAYMVLDQIGRDLSQVETIDETRRRGDPRVWIEDEMLSIRTTDRGEPITQQYGFDPIEGVVLRSVLGQRVRTVDQPAMLGQVYGVQLELVLPSNERVLPVLSVELRSEGGQTLRRTYVLSSEDVQL